MYAWVSDGADGKLLLQSEVAGWEDARLTAQESGKDSP